MYGRKWTQRGFFAVMALALLSCAQIVGMEEGVLRDDGPGTECALLADCEADATECRRAKSCAGGKCVYENVLRGTQLEAQTIGDCREVVCDGDGATEVVVADMDIEDDVNGCTTDTCKAGNPVHTPVAVGTMVTCYDGPAGTAGVSFCKEGTAVCDDKGNPGPCEGQVLPQAEVCDTMPIDENCNGMVNETGVEGGTCQCGDGATSAGIGEACDDGNIVGGDGCSPICSNVQVEQLANHGPHTCIRTNTGVVKCWGYNLLGQLGVGSMDDKGDGIGEMGANLAEVPLGTGKVALDIAVGGTFACAILKDEETLRCWGDNTYGQLGEGAVGHRGDAPGEMGDAMPEIDLGPNVVPMKLVGGKAFMCAVMNDGMKDGRVKCWGRNDVGQLGIGDSVDRGLLAMDMGANLPFVDLGTDVGLGTEHTVKALAAGGAFNCAILEDDTVKCWGHNEWGQLGLGDTINRGSAPGQLGNNLPIVALGTNKKAKQIAVGYGHACALLDDNSVKCWGYNLHGQLGQGDAENRGDGPDEMGDNLKAIELGTGRTAIAIDVGELHSCAILDDGSLKCWGFNAYGQLGSGNMLAYGVVPDSMGDVVLPIELGTGRKIKEVHAADLFTCALFDDTSVKCWGHGVGGRLGYEDVVQRGDEPNEMGDNLPFVKLFSDTW
jgi:cysteine-rich repeat protein